MSSSDTVHSRRCTSTSWDCALDSTSYVLAAGQARPGGEEMAGQDSGPTGVGHSVLAAPDGTRVAEAGYDEEILYGEVDVDTVAATRKALPVLDA